MLVSPHASHLPPPPNTQTSSAATTDAAPAGLALSRAQNALDTQDDDDFESRLWDVAADIENLLQPSERTQATSWEAQALDVVLAGGELDPPPELMPRTDGRNLIYAGHVHSIAGESNTGKTWVALHAAVACLVAGQRVVFLDFEDRASRVVGRLIALGATPDQIRDHFVYVRPNRAITAAGKRVLERLVGTARLVILDGVTEAMTMHGLEPKDQDIAKFYELLPRWIADHGPAVLDLDHTVKDRKEQGLYATGGQHKRAGLDGAGYILRVIEPIGRGHAGKVKMIVSKDRPGYVGKPGDTAAVFTLDATDETKVIAALEPPEPVTTTPDGDFRPTHIMQKVSAFLALNPGAGMKEIKIADLGKWPFVQKAVKALIVEEYVHVEQAGRKHEHHNLRPFTEHDDPIDSHDWHDREPPEDDPW